MLSVWEMDDMRAEFVAACDKLCTIQNPGLPVSGPGGDEPGVIVETQRRCRVEDLVGAEREVGGRLSGIADVLILLEYGDSVDFDASLIVGPNTYAVVRVASPSTQPVALRVYGQEIH